MLARLGKNNDAWALGISGVVPMLSPGRRMQGWVRGAPHVYGDDLLRRKLLDAIRREDHRGFLREIGARLEEARKKAGLTTGQLTEKMNRELTSKEVAQMHLRWRCFGVVLNVG